jgi:hypothetical protein
VNAAPLWWLVYCLAAVAGVSVALAVIFVRALLARRRSTGST